MKYLLLVALLLVAYWLSTRRPKENYCNCAA